MTATVIETPKGERLVMLPEAEYLRLKDAAEGRKPRRREAYMPAAFANRIMAGEIPSRVFREWRGLKALDIAASIGVSKSYMADIESGRRTPSPDLAERLAKALGIDPEDLVPARQD